MRHQDMTDEELEAEVSRLELERERRRRREEAEQDRARIVAQVDALLLELQQLDGVQAGAEWEWPTTSAGAYPLGAVVTWEGRTWENITPSNPHAPGVSGWAIVPEVDPETGKEIPPPFVRPAGAHDAYHPGKTITWEDGLVYRPTRGGVVHTPAESPGDWELEAAPDPEPQPVEPDPDEDEPVDPKPEEPALPGWEVGKAYTAGDQFTYQGATYSVLQGHTSAAHWPPDQVASLYEVP